MTDDEHVRDLEVIESLQAWADDKRVLHDIVGRTVAEVAETMSDLDGFFSVTEKNGHVLVHRLPMTGRLPSGIFVAVSEDGTFVLGGILHWNVEDYRRTLETKITQTIPLSRDTSLIWACTGATLEGVYSEAIL